MQAAGGEVRSKVRARSHAAAPRRNWAAAVFSSVLAGLCGWVWLCVHLPVTDIDI